MTIRGRVPAKTLRSLLLAGAAAAVLASCVSVPWGAGDPSGGQPTLYATTSAISVTPSTVPVLGPASYLPPVGAVPFPGEKLSPTQRRLLAGAKYVLGRTVLDINGQHFNDDCSGTILAIYAYAGINLVGRFDRYTGSGVVRIYKIMKAHNLLYKTYYPKPGDIIFWDNTYDENGNGKWDDPLTHAGMVVGVSPNGEISYIHQNYRKGIIIEHMNLLYPNIYKRIVDGVRVIVNSPMRMIGSPPGPGWLAGQLIDSLGKGYLLKS